jgi:hypothetical protein
VDKSNEHRLVFDENKDIHPDDERLPVHPSVNVLRYHTLKKSNGLGWWSAVVLTENYGKKEICYYRWKKRDKHWKRDKKLPFRTRNDWEHMKEIVEKFMDDLEGERGEEKGEPKQ